jgi:hypothetical protein
MNATIVQLNVLYAQHQTCVLFVLLDGAFTTINVSLNVQSLSSLFQTLTLLLELSAHRVEQAAMCVTMKLSALAV